MAQDDKPPSFDEFDARLRKARSQDGSGAGEGQDRTIGRTKFGVGLQVGIELVAGVVGGALLGFALDRWLGTAPLFLIVFFMLGAVAGTANAYRWLRRFSESFPNEESSR
jgi:ATP synthase protein I